MRRAIIRRLASALVLALALGSLVAAASPGVEAARPVLARAWDWSIGSLAEPNRTARDPAAPTSPAGVHLQEQGLPRPVVSTSKNNYVPGETVLVSGSEWLPGETVTLVFRQRTETPTRIEAPITVTADSDGFIEASYPVDERDQDVTYDLRATGSSGRVAAAVFFDGPGGSASLEQCRNGTATSPNDCAALGGGTGWVTGNVGAQQGHLVEGYSIPYRAILTNLPLDTPITLVLGYDIRNSSANAIDFLTHYQRLEPHTGFGHPAETVFPISGVAGAPATFSTFPIPAPDLPTEPGATFAGLPDGEKLMTLYGGTITDIGYVSQGSLAASQAETLIGITFVATSETAVLAWGGHIATATDWGAGNSASGISGSPYHMRLNSWLLVDPQPGDKLLNLGNQDRSLSAVTIFPSGQIIIRKNTVPPDTTPDFAFTKDYVSLTRGAGAFTLKHGEFDDSGPSLLAGTYNVSETLPAPAGWSLTGITCTVTGGNGSAYTPNVPAGTLQIVLEGGDSVDCTFTNTKQTQLHLLKTVTNDNGGLADPTDWTLSASGPTPISGATPVDSGPGFEPGTYSLGESGGPAGYTAGAWSCVLTGTMTTVPVTTSQVTIGSGQDVTCTINNDDDLPALRLRKTVTSDNGGLAAPEDWTLTAMGTGGAPTSLSGTTPVNSGAGFKADTYTLGESGGPAGYTAGAWSCVLTGTMTPVTVTANQVTVGLGQDVTCTIHNDDTAPSLTLDKIVVNDNGGTAEESAWSLTADGGATGTLSGPGAAGHTDVVSGPLFQVGTYALSESTGPAGYTAGTWSCVKNGGDPVSGNSVTLGFGDAAVCTITNDDDPPALHLLKTVTNDNGGDALATAWTLTATGAGGAPTNLSGATPVNSGTGFKADTYTLSESGGAAGYTAGAWSCVLTGTVTPVTVTANQVIVGLGQDVTCTIGNDDDAPALHLLKTVTNDNGGDALATAWTLTAAGAGGTPTNLSGTTPVDSGAGFKADTYTLGESGGPAGYTAGAWSCVLTGTATPVTVTANQVIVGLGQDVTCTIDNDDDAPALHLLKTVTNDNGGDALATAWTLTAAGAGGAPTNLSGATPVNSGAGFKADTYTLGESGGPAGYTAGAWSCVLTGTTTPVTVTANQVTVGLGQDVTCTIDNDDNAPSLTLDKVVVNDHGGTAEESAWTLTANGGAAGTLSGPGAAGATDVVSGPTFRAGVYTLSESAGPAGYAAGPWSCVKNGGAPVTGSAITLGLGDTAVCTITNDDLPGTIIVRKVTTPLNSGSFTFTTTGAGYVGFTLPGGNENSQTLSAGSYTVTEEAQIGWVLTGIGGDPSSPYACTVTGSGGSSGVGDLNTRSATVVLKNGDTVTCVFENTGQGVTRTQGFWSTHTPLALIAWAGGSAFGHTFPGVALVPGIGDTLICGRPVDDLGKLMGGFWSDIPRTSDRSRRTPLDQTRMQLLQQLLAAELNGSAFGTVPAGGPGMFALWESALCGTDQGAVRTAMQQAAAFNSAGDSGLFTPGVSADSRYARTIANLVFWDIIVP